VDEDDRGLHSSFLHGCGDRTSGARRQRESNDSIGDSIVSDVPEDAPLLQAKRATVRHGVHAVLIAPAKPADSRVVSDSGLLAWLKQDVTTMPAAHAITEPPHFIAPDAGAAVALHGVDVRGRHQVEHVFPARPYESSAAVLRLVGTS
jgi:hypothetical protein